MRGVTLRLGWGAASMLVAGTLHASATFPDVVAQTLQLGSPPPCVVCHNTPLGGLGTADTPVGTYLRSRGVKGGDTGSLQGGLQATIGERHDADGDGVTDVDELKAGTDPNSAGHSDVPPIAYGCGAHIARDDQVGQAAWLVGMVVLALGCLRRPRKRGT
jgi:hypothetical protein